MGIEYIKHSQRSFFIRQMNLRPGFAFSALNDEQESA